MSEDPHLVTRRRVLMGMGAAGLAALAGPELAFATRGIRWDATYDVVVVGSGFAGLSASIEAKRKGAASVAVFEKMPMFGGNSAINGGLFAAPNTPLQEKEGIEDSVDHMVADQLKSGRGVASETLLRHVASHAADGIRFVQECGAEFHPYLLWLGGHSIKRTYQTTVNCGAGITRPLHDTAEAMGVRLVPRARFRGFAVGTDGVVKGVSLDTGYYWRRDVAQGDTINVRARKGVIMATGGFTQNLEFRVAQDPTLTDEVVSTNAPGATGEGMLRMFELGALPVHLAHIQSGPWASPDEGGFGYVANYSIYSFPFSMAVSRSTGRRFMNEIADRKTRADAELRNRDENGDPEPPIMLTSYRDVKDHANTPKILKYGVGWKFDSFEALAKEFGTPLEPLMAQIREYNGYVDSGVDEQFGKPMKDAKGKRIETPVMVVRLWPKVHYCQGGVRVDTGAHVLRADRSRIEGLHAAGEVAGGIHGVSRLGSCSIPDCVVMGRTAANTVLGTKL